MGKPKKANVATMRKVPLEQQLMDGKVAKPKDRKKVNLRAEESSVGSHWIIPYSIPKKIIANSIPQVLDSKTSKKILAAAKQQQLEFNEDNFPSLAPKKSVNFDLGKS